MANVELKVEATEASVLEFIDQLPEDLRQRALELFVFEDIVRAADRQLKRDTDLWAFDTSGYRDGARLREAILKFQGLEPEFKADLESRIRSLEHDVNHYKKYYDWYFKVYHNDQVSDLVRKYIGWL